MAATSALRHFRLPGSGVAVVNTDVHGNGGDFRRLEGIFRERKAEHGARALGVILGDVVHGPSVEASVEYSWRTARRTPRCRRSPI